MGDIVIEAKEYIKELLDNEIMNNFSYHNIEHTNFVLEHALFIGSKEDFNESDIFVLTLAALFHDSGFTITYWGHERESAEIASAFLKSKEIDQVVIDRVVSAIHATKVPQKPTDKVEMVLCDADMFHLSKDEFMDTSLKLREEWVDLLNKDMDKHTYFAQTLFFLEVHHYFTDYGKKILEPSKQANIENVKKELKKYSEEQSDNLKKIISKKKKIKKVKSSVEEKDKEIVKLKDKVESLKQKIEKLPTRGIESMFRLTARNQINLSSIADNKANILISVSSIILSIVGSMFFRKLDDYPSIILPTIIFTVTLLLTITFAILSTRPKISKGKFTKEDISKRKINLLFFGNFYNMTLEEYDWAVREMMNDSEYLYGNMIKDQYFLGVVLSKKYKKLRIAYTVFMFGIIISVVAFAVALSISPISGV